MNRILLKIASVAVVLLGGALHSSRALAAEPHPVRVQILVDEAVVLPLTGTIVAWSCDDPTVARVGFSVGGKSVEARGLVTGITRCIFSSAGGDSPPEVLDLVVSEPDLETR